ncbi:hypothetical protein M2168_005645 [Streptomyces sp. CZ24]|nr:hypothetical protein [Streptomyces sp. CZ24]
MASTSLLAGCGLVSSDSEEEEQEIVVGTMSAPTTLDPAAAWDGSWELYRNIFQTLVAFPPGATEPEPDAAESCRFVDTRNKAYECTLREGLTFSDGAKLDADAVKHSVDRIVTINDKRGPAGLLGSLDRVEAKDERTVTFYLNKPDATFPFVLSAPAFSIVSPKSYPADKLREGDSAVGSGPYTLEDYKPEGHADLAKNATYKGPAKVGNSAVSIQYFKDSGTMVEALKKEEIDVTFRGLAAEDVVALNGENRKAGIQLVEAAGTEIRYLVFNPKDPWAKNPAVRKAVAQTVDRGAIAHKVYRDTVEPLYSMVPRGLTGHATSYFDRFGKAGREQGRADPLRGRDQRAGPADALVHHRPVRLGHREGVQGTEAAARRLRTLRRDHQGPPVEDLRARLPQGRVPRLRARLVPRLPRRGQLHRPVRRGEQRAEHAVPRQGDHRRPAAAVAPGERPGRGRRAVREGAVDHAGGHPAAAAVAGQAVHRRQRGDRRRRTRSRPLGDHDDVGAEPQAELVAAGRPSPSAGEGPGRRVRLSVGAGRFSSDT